MRVTLRVVLLFSFATLSLAAQDPRITNAQLEKRPLRGRLADELRATGATPRWIAWTVDTPRDIPSSSGCYWETASSWDQVSSTATLRTVFLESPPRALILFRVDPNLAPQVRAFTIDCELNAGGLPVTLLEQVSAEDSLAALESFAGESRERTRAALRAIALHAHPVADAILERHAAYSLIGSHRGSRGFDFLSRQTLSPEIVSAIAANADPRATAFLIETARHSSAPQIRKAAVRALSRSRDRRARAYLEEIIER